MTTHTKRDSVWSAALTLAETGKFDLEDVLRVAGLDDASERTARDVLTTMTDMGHLHQGKHQVYTGKRYSWRPVWYTPEQYEAHAPQTGHIEWSDDARREMRDSAKRAIRRRHG